MNVVVVESPAKAKTINKYLGKDYYVLASFGHVRDLEAKDGAVDPEQDFAMRWLVDDKSKKRVKDIANAVKGADQLILATDPDREGEAISWHINEILKDTKALKGVPVKRVVFNAITKKAIQEAFQNPRDINSELVEAYLARRALDYLVGFNLSPVLWRKLPGSKSAGRVQSVALRLVCEREAEIEVFKPREYWSVEVGLSAPNGTAFMARLTHLDGAKLDKFDLSAEADAQRAVAALQVQDFRVSDVETRQARRNPQPPFITSTLQQDASRKLGMSAQETMRVAQKLYEGVDVGGETVGLITYMRTDGVQLSAEAIGGIRDLIGNDYGSKYLPGSPRHYATKAKNAQEAHEAIRPTDLTRRPKDVAQHLDDQQRKLYDLIWKRTVASQMESAVFDQAAVDLDAPDGKTRLRANGSVLVFDGFLTLYQEAKDDGAEDDENDRRLPPLAKGDACKRGEVKPEQHFTQPPPRYSEASLVKKMEELGIGRPSTYASILQVLRDRDYVELDKRRFVPTDRGRIVTSFLSGYFARYVEYDFTANLENLLDEISGGRADWKAVLREFWTEFKGSIDGTKELTISQVIDHLDSLLGEHFFPARAEGADPRGCPACSDGRLSLKLGKFGAFIGCSNYPECRFTRQLAVPGDSGEGGDGAEAAGPIILGNDPVTGDEISLRKGPYGNYVQQGEGDAKAKIKPKRSSLPRGLSPADVTLEKALSLLSLPREVGLHPETQKPIMAGIGRFGPYLLHDGKYANLGGDDDVLEIGINRAVTVIADAAERRGNRGSAPAGKEIGKHPEDSEPVTLHSGRYGPYVKHGKLLASLPRGAVAEEFTLDQAVALIAEKGKVPGGGRKAATKTPKAKAGTKAPAPKTAAKSKTAAKTTKSKSTASKATGSKTSGSKTSSKKGATSKPPESSAAD